jgi:hypothetical protein
MPRDDIAPGSLANPEQPDARPMSRACQLRAARARRNQRENDGDNP